MKITIGGCRDFEDYAVFSKFVGECIKNINPQDKIIILSGHCKGVDMMAERYASEMGYEIEIHAADWKRYGRAAGPKRNLEMVENSDVVIAFWDNKSKGTGSLVGSAKRKGVPVYIKSI